MVENAPVPGASFLAKLTGWTAGKIADKGLSTMLPGDYTLINILIELSKGPIQMDHFESPNFYLKIGERENLSVYAQRELDAIEDPEKRQKKREKREKASEIAKGSEFSLSFEKHYKTRHTKYYKKYLNTNSETLNNDYCLEILHNLEGKQKNILNFEFFKIFQKISLIKVSLRV